MVKLVTLPQTVFPDTTLRRRTRAFSLQAGYPISELDKLPPYEDIIFPFHSEDDSLTSSSSSPTSSPAPEATPLPPSHASTPEPSVAIHPPPMTRRTMSTSVAKEFSEVPKLAADGQNYRLWIRRI